MKTLHIFYDGGCGLCGKLRDRFEAEPARMKLHFVAYQSAEANDLVPDLARHQPEKGILALTDDGQLLRGVDSWLGMLAATNRFRGVAGVLGFPLFKPVTRLVYERVAQNRRLLSRLLGLQNLTAEEEKCNRCAW